MNDNVSDNVNDNVSETVSETIAAFGITGAQFIPLLRERLAKYDCAIEGWHGDNITARDALIERTTCAIISPDFVLQPGNFGALIRNPKLRLIAQPWVGVDWIDPKELPKDLIYCNAGGHAAPMAEYVMGAILQHVLELAQLDADMRQGRWYRSGRNNAANALRGDLAEKTIGIIGYGEIGRAIAKRADAFNMRCIAIARSPRPAPAPLDWLGTRDALPQLLEQSDFLVMACDLNASTLGMIDAHAFALLPRHAFLVNVARGEVIDETALYDALKAKRIAAAAIDTWYRYPSDVVNPEPDPDRGGAFQGSQYDFASLDNVVLTPHCAAHTRGADKGRYLSIADTLAAYFAGEPLTRHVVTGAGTPRDFLPPDAEIKGHGRVR